ncbi:MAG: hypothetical protein E7773_14775 [Sphingomonas sp.]|uniref:hypothetical protein n=1 Tax=Sphingomonas sp. TaxID=28214 RepID=UPI0012291D04|nr:hypothetical protein [Sphingomonas sp.]THD34450.1 MAG: hypothetical protein E7773_14775 [Sphingomonas sp.]
MAREDAIEMRAVMARWDALRERWALDADEEAGLLGGAVLAGPIGEVASWRAASMEQRMRLLIDLGVALDALLADGVKVCLWLRRPRDSMGGMSPIDAMSSSVEWIRSLRKAALDFIAY